MKLSFLPGDLHLTQERDGTYVITQDAREVFRSKIEKRALSKFNSIRSELEATFPAHELTSEDKSAALYRSLMDRKLIEVRASTKPPKKDKIRGTRTFG